MGYPQGSTPAGYAELADLLRERITSGDIRPGQRLPSERDLSQTYGVATKTARAALRQLRDEGLAVMVRGYGVVVREQVEPEIIDAEPGSIVWTRSPTPTERREHDVPEGVPMLIITGPDGLDDPLPGHRYRVRVSPT